MVRRCSDKLAKTLMVVFNILFLICGITIVVVSITTNHPSSYDELIKGLKNVNYLFLGVGLFISLMSFLGCCGAWRESSCMINTFLVLLVAILIAEIAVGGIALSKRNAIGEAVKKEGLVILGKNDKTAHELFDDIQSSLKCCGINGVKDYTEHSPSIPVPGTCCGKDRKTTCDVDKAYEIGCYGVFTNQIKGNLMTVGAIALIICFVEVVGIIFACCLRGAINERYESV